MLECGAGIGIVSTVVAVNRRPQEILAFEANPDMIDVIEATYKVNNVADVISVVNAALVSEPDPPEELSFHISKRFSFSSTRTPKKELSRTVSVPVKRFADVQKSFCPTVLLMDIEGAELDFLEHADLDGIHSIVIEFHPDVYGLDGMRRCKNIVRAAGYEKLPDVSTRTVWAASRV